MNGARSHLFTAATISALCLLSAACGDIDLDSGDRVDGSGDVTTETRSIGEFVRVVLSGEGHVRFTEGADGLIEIETDDNLMTHIRTETSGDTLTISTDPDVDIDPSDGVVYRLGCPELRGAVLSGAGSIDLADCHTTDQVALDVSGAGTILAPGLDAATVDVQLSGAGEIEADGRTDRLTVELSGAGNFVGDDLHAVDADVRVSGAGTAALWATGTLDLRLSGVGSVRYFGEPSVMQTVTGVGAVESLGPK